MKFMKLNESPLSYLSRLDEDVAPVVEDTEVLYEDNDFSKTPQEADEYRTAVEEVLGIELDGNQVEYLAENHKGFFRNAHKFAFMKDSILQCLSEAGLLTDEELDQAESSDADMYGDDLPIEQDERDYADYEKDSGIDDVDDNFDLNFSDNELARMKSIDAPIQASAPSDDVTDNSMQMSSEVSDNRSDTELVSTQQEMDDMGNSVVDVPDDEDISDEDVASLNKILGA